MSHRITDFIIISILFLLAVFIWLRDISWISSSDDTLPILVALPLFWWIGSPWVLRPDPQPLSPKGIALSIVLFVAGIALNFTLMLTLGWVVLLWSWLSK